MKKVCCWVSVFVILILFFNKAYSQDWTDKLKDKIKKAGEKIKEQAEKAEKEIARKKIEEKVAVYLEALSRAEENRSNAIIEITKLGEPAYDIIVELLKKRQSVPYMLRGLNSLVFLRKILKALQPTTPDNHLLSNGYIFFTNINDQSVKDEIGKDLAVMLKWNNTKLVHFAIRALGVMKAKEYAKDIAEFLNTNIYNEEIVYSAMYALGEFNSKEYASSIANLLDDPKFRYKKEVIETLGHLKATEFAPNIAKFLNDKNAYTRNFAAKALAELKAKDYINNIVEMLSDKEKTARAGAVYAIIIYDDKELVSHLAKVLYDDDYFIRKTAVEGISKYGGREYIPHIKKLLDDDNELVRIAVINALYSLKYEDIIPTLEERLNKEKNQLVRDVIEIVIFKVKYPN